MRRILLVLSLLSAMAMSLAAMAVPALADFPGQSGEHANSQAPDFGGSGSNFGTFQGTSSSTDVVLDPLNPREPVDARFLNPSNNCFENRKTSEVFCGTFTAGPPGIEGLLNRNFHAQ